MVSTKYDRKNIPNARRRILDASVKVLSGKGFEGARIDQIAREAGVPKSLIYYHFKGKKEILDVLMQEFLEEYRTVIAAATGEGSSDYSEGSLEARIMNAYGPFMEKNADLIRIAVIESLKKTVEKPVIFDIAETVIGFEGKNPLDDSLKERMIAEFFTSVVPSLAYTCYRSPWEKHYEISREDLGRMFVKIVGLTHGAYHRREMEEG